MKRKSPFDRILDVLAEKAADYLEAWASRPPEKKPKALKELAVDVEFEDKPADASHADEKAPPGDSGAKTDSDPKES